MRQHVRRSTRSGALRHVIAALAALPLSAGMAAAQTLNMGIGSPVSSIDPHYHLLRSNSEVSQMLFDTLLTTDAQAQLRPGLAESWRAMGEEGWEFRLRENIRFHDGTPFTADDVAFTLERIPTITGPGASFTTHIRPVSRVEVVDARTVRLYTRAPSPLLPVYLSQVPMLGRRLHADATTADFNSGRVAIGTGPFRFSSYTPGDRLEVTRNEAYWGEKPEWASVNYRMISNDGARTAALLAGDVDFIDQIPTADLDRLRADNRFRVAETTSLRVMYITLDAERTPPVPQMAAADGGPLQRNPLADQRVRKALSLAIDRRLIVERVMQKAALATGQFMPPGAFSHIDNHPVPTADADTARRLLAEAGYPQGFQITLAGSNDRYMNDSRVVQAIGQMWTRIGVRTTVEAQPYATFIGRATRREFPAALLTWGNSTGDASVLLNSVLRTRNRDRGHGAANRTHYSNAEVDRLTGEAEREMDDAKRDRLLQQASLAAIDDVALVPLYLQNALWAMRRDLTYTARADERNDPTAVRRTQR
ncbi:ABC transporter substrate-binding protein [Roseomonas frigidaquae]|uniref:ABC transporter substrate-binding protein n=1 Tax=Falsiroseomonas frigidaquae TaxID=487318 RepID=A0ABX1EU67_9PROT|nr:ABC transporter substrate-binding protein [Falsiroseomonas frigidaquae]NKE44070.1 ABC transporter substrate-binding protein [Falsiroseomonas frigidaquae]